MSFNSSPPLNAFAAQSSSESLYFIFLRCFNTTTGMMGLSVFTAINILVVLPLCVLILHVGVRRWWRGSSVAVSHSDHFTYNLILTDLVSVAGFVLTCCGIIAALPLLGLAGTYIFSLSLFAHVFLDILTCVERYLAVVHPITYRTLKNAKGTRIRSASIGIVWLLSLTEIGLLSVKSKISTASVLISFTVSALIAVSFCSVAILYALIHPGPGERRQHVDQSKLRAFYTILAIAAVMMIRIGGNVFISVFYASSQVENDKKCNLILFLLWTCLPTSLLPIVLFLHRAGIIFCCKFNRKKKKKKNDSKNSAKTTKTINLTSQQMKK